MFAWLAALASAESGALGALRIKEELHVLRLRPSRGASRTAVDVSRAYAIKQRAIEAPIAGDNGVPKFLRIVGCDCCGSHASQLMLARRDGAIRFLIPKSFHHRATEARRKAEKNRKKFIL